MVVTVKDVRAISPGLITYSGVGIMNGDSVMSRGSIEGGEYRGVVQYSVSSHTISPGRGDSDFYELWYEFVRKCYPTLKL